MGSGGLLLSTVASWRLTCEAGVVMDSVRSNVRAASCFVFEQQPFLLGAQLVHGLFVLTQTQFIHLPAALQRQQGGIFSQCDILLRAAELVSSHLRLAKSLLFWCNCSIFIIIITLHTVDLVISKVLYFLCCAGPGVVL